MKKAVKGSSVTSQRGNALWRTGGVQQFAFPFWFLRSRKRAWHNPAHQLLCHFFMTRNNNLTEVCACLAPLSGMIFFLLPFFPSFLNTAVNCRLMRSISTARLLFWPVIVSLYGVCFPLKHPSVSKRWQAAHRDLMGYQSKKPITCTFKHSRVNLVSPWRSNVDENIVASNVSSRAARQPAWLQAQHMRDSCTITWTGRIPHLLTVSTVQGKIKNHFALQYLRTSVCACVCTCVREGDERVLIHQHRREGRWQDGQECKEARRQSWVSSALCWEGFCCNITCSMQTEEEKYSRTFLTGRASREHGLFPHKYIQIHSIIQMQYIHSHI